MRIAAKAVCKIIMQVQRLRHSVAGKYTKFRRNLLRHLQDQMKAEYFRRRPRLITLNLSHFVPRMASN